MSFSDNAKENFPVKRKANKRRTIAEMDFLPLKNIPETSINQDHFLSNAYEREIQNKLKSQDMLKNEYNQMIEKMNIKKNKQLLNEEKGTGLQIRGNDSDQTKLERQQKYKMELDKSGAFDRPIVTEITPFTKFYPAENYHQQYFEDNENTNP